MKAKELAKLVEVIEALDLKTATDTGVAKVSGGYSTTELIEYRSGDLMLCTVWGVKSDVSDYSYTEKNILDRDMLGITDVKAIIASMEGA